MCLRDLKTNQMRFLQYSGKEREDLIEVTAMAHSPSRKHKAVGYVKAGDKKCYIAVHNVKNAGLSKLKMLINIDLFEGQEVPTS